MSTPMHLLDFTRGVVEEIEPRRLRDDEHVPAEQPGVVLAALGTPPRDENTDE